LGAVLDESVFWNKMGEEQWTITDGPTPRALGCRQIKDRIGFDTVQMIYIGGTEKNIGLKLRVATMANLGAQL
jgi:hypothetical protein